MTLYAELPGQRARQILFDLLSLAWTLLWIKLATVVHGLVERLAAPGRALQDGGNQLSRSLADAARRAGTVPVLGHALRDPLQAAGDASHQLASAGAGQQTAANRLALLLALVVAAAPILAVLLRYLPARLRWIRSATAAAALRDRAVDLDLFAIRALAGQPLSQLRRLGPDPAGAYLRQEPGATEALAELELAAAGLRPSRWD